ncbi:MAG TPA: hypothetical protein PLO23_07460 [Alphaproteobacteria bacterium]|nr:hypothetical protein [Alphaproteobacteria bacterium]
MDEGIKMRLYIKVKSLFAIHAEWKWGYEFTPIFSIHACNGETIIDIPYGQIIFTPRRVLRLETTKTRADQGMLDEPSSCVTENFARAAKNRFRVSVAIRGVPGPYFRKRRAFID